MDQGNKEGLNSSKKKRMEKTNDDQKELDDQMEQTRKRFKEVTTAQLQEIRLLVAATKGKTEKQALVLSPKESSTNKETDSEETVTDKETDSEETETDQEEEEEEASVISPAGSSRNNPKGMKKKKKKKLIRGEEKKSKSNSLSDTCTSTLRILYPPGDQGSSCRKNLQ